MIFAVGDLNVFYYTCLITELVLVITYLSSSLTIGRIQKANLS